MRRYEFYSPTAVTFGRGALNKLGKMSMPGKKALLVISNGKSTVENGYLERTINQLKRARVEYVLFNKIQPNPLKETVEEGGKVAVDNNCDFIVALGGGSVMDACKGIAVMATNGGDLWDYMGGTGKGLPIEKDPLPIIAITTTAGTGSEVDCGGVITNTATKEKIAISGEKLYPVIAIVDPELMLSVPPKYTAYQGFDALFHSTETFINKNVNPMSDMVALTAIENIAKYLPLAVKDGSDIEAREHVAFANTMSGYSMEAGGCTSEHSLEHAMSAYHQDLPHGAGLIMISKAYYTFFIEKGVCPNRFVKMAKAMGMAKANKPSDFIVALDKLIESCGVSDLKMSDYGITKREFKTLSENARTAMGGLYKCDRCDLSVEDGIAIYEKSYK